jgi:DNA-directed RNA polymerase subunit RPC12/RpoP
VSGRVSCPRCNSLQNFQPHLREVPDQRWLEEYVRCRMCGHEVIVRETTVEIDRLGKRYRELMDRVRYEAGKHGAPTHSTLEKLIEVGTQWSKERERLKLEVEAFRG